MGRMATLQTHPPDFNGARPTIAAHALRLFILFFVVILGAEFAVMLMLRHMLPADSSPLVRDLLDPLLLAILAVPVLLPAMLSFHRRAIGAERLAADLVQAAESVSGQLADLKAAHEGHDDIHGDFASGSGEPCALCIHFAAYQLENNISKIKDESISYLSGFDLTTIEYAITRVNKCLPNEPTCRVNSVPVIKPLTVAAVVRSVPLTQ